MTEPDKAALQSVAAKSAAAESTADYWARQRARRVHLPQGQPVAHWLLTAQALTPTLTETPQPLQRWVQAIPAPHHLLRWEMVVAGTLDELQTRVWQGGEHFILDFGGHRTGHCSFNLTAVPALADAPVRLRLVFGEVPPDVAEPLHPYHGVLSAAWLPEETLTVDELPTRIRLPRRHAFRYVRVEVLATSSRFGVCFDDWLAHALTSAVGVVPALPAATPAWVRQVDLIAQATLRDCMQTVFEDGPRRDRRLWLGDLRLQALASHATVQADAVLRRCLYLFAALPRSDGMVNGCVQERPSPRPGQVMVLDYAALFAVTLQEYVQATGDLETGVTLWPVARRQVELLLARLDGDALFHDDGATWCFIDWSQTLDRDTAMQGVILFAIDRSLRLAEQIGRATDVQDWADCAHRMRAAVHRRQFDAALGLWRSGESGQLSVASQAWMVLGGVAADPAQAARALQASLAMPGVLQPTTPYLMHYVVEALVACGQRQQALAVIQDYWGAMVEAGADTFWEAFEPGQPLSTPYGDLHANSWCHAWSCTPSHFFRLAGLAAEAAAIS